MLIIGAISMMNANAIPAEELNKTFGGGQRDTASYVQQIPGGYIISGSTSSFGDFFGDAWLIKTDTNGNEQWNRTFGGKGLDTASAVQQTSDDGYIIIGQTFVGTNEGGLQNTDVWLIKVDKNGNEQWDKKFGRDGADTTSFVQQTNDGGFIIVGTLSLYGKGYDTNVWLIKTDSSGNEQWSKTFGDNNISFGNAVQQTSDGGYVVAGEISLGSDQLDAWLIKTDINGNEQWNKIFGGPKSDFIRSVQQSSDGGFILAGVTGDDGWLIKTDIKGNEQWNKTFGGKGEDWILFVNKSSDGGYILAGRTNSYSVGGDDDAWIIKTDNNGTEQWKKTLGGTGNDGASSVQQISNNSFIISGWTNSYGAGNDDAWLIKLSEGPSKITITPKSVDNNMDRERPVEKIEGFEAVMSIFTLFAIYLFRKK